MIPSSEGLGHQNQNCPTVTKINNGQNSHFIIEVPNLKDSYKWWGHVYKYKFVLFLVVKWPDCNETQTLCFVAPTGFILQVSSSYLKTCWKKAQKNFPLAASSAEITLSNVCGHQGAKNSPTMSKISRSQDTHYISVCTKPDNSI